MKWLQVLLFNTNYSLQHNSFICIQSNCFKYCYVLLIIQFRQTVKEFQILLFNTNNFIQYYAFICTLLDCSMYCYVSLPIVCIEFKCQIIRLDQMIRPYQVLPLRVRVDLEVMAMKGYATFSKVLGLEPNHQIVLCHI